MRRNKNASKEWKKIIKLERFSIFQSTTKPQTWQVRLPDSVGGLRRRFKAKTLEEAIHLAPSVAGLETAKVTKPKSKSAQISSRRTVTKPKGLTIEAAFMGMLKASKQNEYTKLGTSGCIVRFMEFLAIRFPNVTHWNQLERKHVRAYMDGLEGTHLEKYLKSLEEGSKPKAHFLGFRKKAPNWIRLALQPIRATSRYMAREYDFPIIDCGGFGESGKPVKKVPRVYLEQVVGLCEFLIRAHPEIAVGVLLQGVCGLRESETLRLPTDSVNLDEGFLRIQGKVKNDPSERCIPIPQYVLNFIEKCPLPDSGWVVPLCEGDPEHPPYDYREYRESVNRAIRQYDSRIGWGCGALRKAFTQWAERNGISESFAERYIGHKVKGVKAHYMDNITDATPEGIVNLMENLAEVRREVTDPLDQSIKEILQKLKSASYARSLGNAKNCNAGDGSKARKPESMPKNCNKKLQLCKKEAAESSKRKPQRLVT